MLAVPLDQVRLWIRFVREDDPVTEFRNACEAVLRCTAIFRKQAGGVYSEHNSNHERLQSRVNFHCAWRQGDIRAILVFHTRFEKSLIRCVQRQGKCIDHS